MKKTFEQKIIELQDIDSVYYCGSAVFLSLESFLNVSRKEIVDFKKTFPDWIEINERLFDEDPLLFHYSLEKKELKEEEYDEIELCLLDYGEEIEDLELLASLYEKTEMNMSIVLRNDSLFLREILRDNLSSFFDREDKPTGYDSILNEALLHTRGKSVSFDGLEKRSKSAFTQSAIDSIHASLAMLEKLMKRKEKGKRPFSTQFQYEEKKNFLLEMEKKKEYQDKEIQALSDTAIQASSEIQTPSLKNDYKWISSNLELMKVFLP